jgi:DNA-binding MurR/RpiR family transcriptional regulator
VGPERLRHIDRHETILVIAKDPATERLLDLVADGQKRGALVLALERSNPDLVDLADQVLIVPESPDFPYFDVVQHVVTQIAPGDRTARTHVRGRLRALLEARTAIRRQH